MASRGGGRVSAFCDICGKGYDMRDPAIRWLAIDGAWTCADEVACFDRKAAVDECMAAGR